MNQKGRLSHYIPQWIKGNSCFFITICTDPKGLNQLCHPILGMTLLSSAKFYHNHEKWTCRLMILMPDHLHAMVSFQRKDGLKQTISSWKSFTARKLSIHWQRDFFDHRIRDHHEYVKKCSYILNNPIRAGLCHSNECWPYVLRNDERLLEW